MLCRARHPGLSALSTGRVLGQPGVRALLLLGALVAAYCVYGALFFYRDPLSIFFSPAHAYDRFYSAHREAEALAFLDQAAAPAARPAAAAVRAAADAPLCVTLLTVGRHAAADAAPPREYVEAAVGSLLANLSRAERAAVHLKLFFADVPDAAAAHRSLAPLRALGLADEVYTYADTLPPGAPRDARLRELAALADPASPQPRALERKSLLDYAYALDRCRETTRAPYIAVFEDDVLLADGWAARTLRHLRTVERMMDAPSRRPPETGRVAPGRPSDWLYLRLFNQDRSAGWAGGTGFRSNNVPLISVAVGVPLLGLLLLARRLLLPRPLGRHLDGWVLLVVCGLAVPAGVWLFFASGKASLVGSPPGVREEWFGCCNQALVYKRAHVDGLARLLAARAQQPAGGRADMLNRDFAWQRGLARLSAYPMLAQHVGLVSATRTRAAEARQIWNLAFETFRPAALAAQHVSDVAALFGPDAAKELTGA